MSHEIKKLEEWDFEDPPIFMIKGGALIWKAFCTREASPEEVAKLANEYHHPGTTNGWVYPSDESYQEWCDANNEKWNLPTPFTVEELKNGIVCQRRPDTHKHYILHM